MLQPGPNNSVVVVFAHERSTIEQATLVRRDDFNDVVSNLGGGLGLYLGRLFFSRQTSALEK